MPGIIRWVGGIVTGLSSINDPPTVSLHTTSCIYSTLLALVIHSPGAGSPRYTNQPILPLTPQIDIFVLVIRNKMCCRYYHAGLYQGGTSVTASNQTSCFCTLSSLQWPDAWFVERYIVWLQLKFMPEQTK